MNKEQSAHIVNKRKISIIWLLPLVALAIGLWMLIDTINNKGPEIDIAFKTAEGLTAGKTKIKMLNVDIGVVSSVKLNDEKNGVVVRAKLSKDIEPLLRKDTQFWVVKPRIGGQGISGLGTLLSVAYIELSPGKSETTETLFVGLEDIPITPKGIPGLHITLYSDRNYSLNAGDPVLYRGFSVGKVESAEFNLSERKSYYQIFIHAPYDDLVTSTSHFWNTGGINFDASADGISISTGALDTILGGGISFETPADLPPGEPVDNSATFLLYSGKNAAYDRQYEFGLEYIMLFKDSVRGLKTGAPIEYRGIRIGSVKKVNYFDESETNDNDLRIPVLVRMEPARVGYPDTAESLIDFKKSMHNWLIQGLKAQVKTGSLVTGKLYVDMNFVDTSTNYSSEQYAGFEVIPTTTGGLEQMTKQVEGVLAKLQKLPIEPVVNSADATLKEVQQTVKTLRKTTARIESLLAQNSTQAIPGNINKTMVELNKTLSSLNDSSTVYQELNETLNNMQTLLQEMQPVVRHLKTKPNSLIFSGAKDQDIEPTP